MLQNAAKERNQVANEWWQCLSGGEASCFCAESATGRTKRHTATLGDRAMGAAGSSAMGAKAKGEPQELNHGTVLPYKV